MGKCRMRLGVHNDHHTTVVTDVGNSELPDTGPDTVFGDAAAASIAPNSVGRYLLLEQIGKGGMGTVHSAFDPDLVRP